MDRSLTIEAIKEILEEQFPALPEKSVEPFGEGWSNAVFLINGQYVFRFPKDEGAAESLQREINLMPLIKQELSIEIPQFQYIGKTTIPCQWNFVGYPKMDGTFLYGEVYQGFSQIERDSFHQEVACLLGGIQSIPQETLIEKGLDQLNYQWQYQNYLKIFEKDLIPLLPPKEAEQVRRLFQDYLGDPENFSFTPRLLHGDLSGDHILADESGKISGLIDWGGIVIGDPDFELMMLCQEYGPEFITQLLKYYPHENPKRLWKKLHLFILCDLYEECLYEAGTMNDQGIQRIREYLEAL